METHLNYHNQVTITYVFFLKILYLLFMFVIDYLKSYLIYALNN